MDEGLGEDVAHIDASEDVDHLHFKDGEHSFKPENCDTLEPQEVAVQADANSPESSFDVLAEILEGKHVSNADLAENPCSSLQTGDAVGDMVEELTVRNYDGSSVAIAGSSNNKEILQSRQNQFQQFFQLVGVSSSRSKRDFNEETPGVWQDASKTSFPESSTRRPISVDHNEGQGHLATAENNAVLSDVLSHGGGIKTKILSKSGFSEFFVKTTLKGKGIIFRGPTPAAFKTNPLEKKSIIPASGPKFESSASVPVSGIPLVASDTLLVSGNPSSDRSGGYECEGASLREWLKSERHKVNKPECLSIFRQIVDIVDYSYSQGVVLYDLHPSSFRMLHANQVKYVGSGLHKELSENAMNKDVFNPENPLIRRRPVERGLPFNVGLSVKKQKFNDNANFSQWPLFQRTGNRTETQNENDATASVSQDFHTVSGKHYSNVDYESHDKSMSEWLEEKWYTSPEELNRGICTISSNVYKLGILLFELLGRFDSERAHAAAMSDLRHRILPPNFLSENPKEAGFCLWLLHPEPSCRPTTREILKSEVMNGIQEIFAEELSLAIEEEDAESELLLHFLISLQEQKQKDAAKLKNDIMCLETDIEEVQKRCAAIKSKEISCLHDDSMSRKPPRESLASSTAEMRLIKNIHHLESAYFSMRNHVHLPETLRTMRSDRDLLRNHGKSCSMQENVDRQDTGDRIGAFFEGLCKYARYNKFETRGVLRTGEFNNSANVICSLSFDRDEDYFAAAGVSKKIKIFEFNSLFSDSVDIHYPAIEMPNRSRLSCVCWNTYIKNYLASSDYDGTVKLWDVSTGQAILQFSEHEKRAWSVDFSHVYPTKLASGSDDCSVKLWNINERNCLGTIRNIANVCCVQFSPHSTHLLAFGSADYRTYCYDLRNLRAPWCILAGHEKAVSYVKFLDNETLVTASTDNSLKLWDLKKTTHGGLSTNACSLTFSGHTNEKNFVGLSTADGYIACGSETNEVYAYYRSLPMPITSYKFGSIDPISGRETDDDNGLFVSSVCWRGKSDMVVAANSSGCIKVLQMV